MVGVVPLDEGLARAEDAGLDLVEVSPNAAPPVCKILDYGKYRYRDQRKAREAKKRQRTFEVKEVKVRPNIDGHDYAVKMRSVIKFLDYGNKVKVTLRFRGRELAHQKLGAQVLERIRTELAERVRIEQMPAMDGRQMVMVVAPVQGLGQAVPGSEPAAPPQPRTSRNAARQAGPSASSTPAVEAAAPAPDLEAAESPAPDVETAAPPAPDLEAAESPAPDVETAAPPAPDLEAAESPAPDVETAAPPEPHDPAAGMKPDSETMAGATAES